MKHIIASVCCLMIFTAATSQNFRRYGQQYDTKHELSIYGMGGYSPVNLALDGSGSKSGSMGGGAGLGYTFNVNSSLGIVTGVEMGVYGTEVSFDNITGDYLSGTDIQEMRFSYSLDGYSEKISITMLSIPLMAQYSLPLGGGSTRFYALAGLKLGFPASAKTDITPGTATTSGHYTHENVEYENLPQHGFVDNLPLPKVKLKLKPGFSTALALEAGLRFSLTGSIRLYTGWYLDYGLNSIQKTGNRHPLEYDPFNEREYKHSSLLNTGLVSKAKLFSTGLKLKIGIGR
jgi:hypothetical protein